MATTRKQRREGRQRHAQASWLRDGNADLAWYGALYSISCVVDSVHLAGMTADTLQNKTLHHERECLVDAVDALTWLIDRDGRVAECETLRAWVVGLLPLVDERRLEDLRREAAGLASEIARLGYMPDTWPGGA